MLSSMDWPAAHGLAPLVSRYQNPTLTCADRTQAFSAWQASKYLEQPGYLNLENGWAISDNGTLMIAIRSEIPQGTSKVLKSCLYGN